MPCSNVDFDRYVSGVWITVDLPKPRLSEQAYTEDKSPLSCVFASILSFNTRVSLIGPQQLLVRHVSSIYKLYVRCLQTLYIEPYVCCIAFARNQNKHHCATHGNRISYL